jgi:isopenicillin N synthase-like dioxygenase
MSIPVIDISSLQSSNRDNWSECVQAIDVACRDKGFFYVTNHGIPAEQFVLMQKTAAKFFALKEAEKQKISVEKSSQHRGWGHVHAEHLDPKGLKDFKEFFNMALDLPMSHPQVKKCPELYGPNQYPDCAEFIQTMQQYYSLVMAVGINILKAMALALKLEEDFFSRNFNTHTSVLRLLHYPVIKDKEKAKAQGAGAHTDYGCITLLYQDQSGGLQVQSNDGEWLDATPIENSFVVNIGNLMQHWTCGVYHSTSHRVVTPENKNNQPRFSMPFFVEPDFDTPVYPLKQFKDSTEEQYDEIISGEWVLSKLAATY